MLEQTKTLIIGVFVVVASALFVSGIYFINPSVGDCGKNLRVRFSEIDKINIGSRVIFAGKPVGEVTAISLLPSSRTGDPDRFGRLYIYELDLCIDSSVEVFDTDEITVYTSGLLGERSIAIIPRAALPGQKATPVGEEEPLYAKASASLEDAMRDLGQLGDKAERALDVVINLIEENKDNIAGAITSFNQTMSSVEDAMAHTKVILDEGAVLASDLRAIVANIRQGRGTLGKLVADDDLYLKTDALMTRADTLMSDINHYGLLFHREKGWQRLKNQRLAAARQLKTCAPVSHCFEDELGKINASISRLAMLLQQAGIQEEQDQDLHAQQFNRVFRELLTDVRGLADSLEFYNQQFAEARS